MPKTIYLESDEEITSVIDKLRKIATPEITIVVPKRAAMIQSIVNLKLLKRQSDMLGKKIIFVTADQTGRNLAVRAGLTAKKNLDQKEELEAKIEKNVETTKQKPKLDLEKLLKDVPKAESKGIPKGKPKTVILDIIKKVKEEKKDEKETEPKKKKLSFKKKRISLVAPEKKAGDEKESTATKKIKPSKPGKPRKVSLVPSINKTFVILFFLASLIITGIIAFIILPKADIYIVPKTEPLALEFDFVIKQGQEGVDAANSIIPGELVVVERESRKERFAATGEKEIGEKAKGTVTIYNKFSSSNQPLVASTRFLSSDGKLFRLTEDVTVPGARIEGGDTVEGTIDVIIEADEAGDDYNIDATSFSLPGLDPDKQEDIYAENSTSFSGGLSKKVKIVSEEDINKAKEQLTEELKKSLIEELKKNVERDKTFLEQATKEEVLEVNTSVDVGEESEEFEVKIKAKISTMEFNESDLRTLMMAKIEDRIPEEKYLVDDNLEHTTFEVTNLDEQEGSMALHTKAEKTISWRLDESKVKGDLAGKRKDEAESYLLNIPYIIGVKVEFWPFWVEKVPKLDKKVELVLDFDNSSDIINK